MDIQSGAAELFPARHYAGVKRGGETYLVIFDMARKDAAIAAVGRWALNPELSFSWPNACELARRINASVDEEEKGGGACFGI